MNKKVFILKFFHLCLFLIAFGIAGNSYAVVIDFDDLNLFEDVTSQYAADGVIFSGIENGQTVNLEAVDGSLYSDIHPSSAPMALSNFYNNNSGLRADAMVMTFTSGASNIAFDYNGAGSSGVNSVINLYDLSLSLISSFTIGSLSPTPVTSWFDRVDVGGTAIGMMEILQPSDSWGHYIDNLTFDAVDVPEPSGLAIFLISLTCLGILRRKRL